MRDLRYSNVLVGLVLTLFSVSSICLTNAAPAMFVFGDSLLDVGNNNYFFTLSKCNKKPYGIDFGGPTGRFTNGKTIVDIVGEKIGIKGYIPAYLAPTTQGRGVLRGVNYASGSAGILNETGKLFYRNINLDAQIDHFANTRQTIIKLKGKVAAQQLLRSNSLFTVAMGSNDLLNNYLIPIVSRSKRRNTPPETFVSTLITRLRKQIKRLYSLDARKFIVTDLSPVGCIPYMRDTKKTKSAHHCYEFGNQMAEKYNARLVKLVSELRTDLKGSIILYVNINHIFTDIVQNYKSYGFTNTDSACCGLVGKHKGLFPCNRLSRICPDRTKYVFWDAFHPTEAANQIIAKRILSGGRDDISPMNIQQLVKTKTK